MTHSIRPRPRMFLRAGALLLGIAVAVALASAAKPRQATAELGSTGHSPVSLPAFEASVHAGKSLLSTTGSPTTVQKPVLLSGDREVQAVWNTAPRSGAPAAYKVELFHGATRTAEQIVCGDCTWATFPGLTNGQHFRASITPIAAGGKALGGTAQTGHAQTGSPAQQSADLIDRAIKEVGSLAGQRKQQDEAGLAVDLTTGKLVAGFTDNQHYSYNATEATKGKYRSSITPRPMKYSTTALKEIRDRIARDAKKLTRQGIKISATSVAPLANKVVVYTNSATAETVQTLAAKYGHDTLLLRQGDLQSKQASNNPEHSPAPRNPPPSNPNSYYGGVVLRDSIGRECTAGYVAYRDTPDNLYLTTAGHCFPYGETVYDGNGVSIGLVDEVEDGQNTDSDAALIPLLFTHNGTNQIIAQASSVWRNVTDEAERFVPGTLVCFSGVTSNGQKCGRNYEETDIIWPNGNVHYDAAVAVNPNFPVRDYLLEGDSGSAVYRSLERSELRVYGVAGGAAWYQDDDGNVLAGGFYYTFDTRLNRDWGAYARTTPVP
ncbi:S1 family peptidase [Spirillospora sp. NBC_00431]